MKNVRKPTAFELVTASRIRPSGLKFTMLTLAFHAGEHRSTISLAQLALNTSIRRSELRKYLARLEDAQLIEIFDYAPGQHEITFQINLQTLANTETSI